MNESLLPQQEHQIQTEGKTFGIRAGAYIIDSVVFFVTNFVVQIMIGLIIGYPFRWLRNRDDKCQTSRKYMKKSSSQTAAA